MKKISLLLLGMLWFAEAFSQSTPVYTENFESYPIGMGIAFLSPVHWETWNDQPGTHEDGIINPVHFSSGSQSLQIYDQPVQTDLLLKLGDKTSGKYEVSWKMYFEAGCGGHFNIQHFEAPGIEWAYEVWFKADGSGFLRTGGMDHVFNFGHDVWFMVENYIDLDQNTIRLTIGGNLVLEWPFYYQANNTSGTNQLGAVNFYSGVYDASTAKYFVDDVRFMEFQDYTFYLEGFESYDDLDNIAQMNPTWWKTWFNLPGTYEDGIVLGTWGYSGTHSLLIDYVPGNTDVILGLGERTTGQYRVGWKMYIQDSYGGYYNIQHFAAAGAQFAFEVWFNEDGSGFLRTGGTNYPFQYPKNTWFQVDHFINLDNDWIDLVINGTVIHQWPFSYQAHATTGINQLGGVDFYAGTYDGSPPQYFVDDIVFIPTDPSAIPVANWAVILAAGLMVLFAGLMIWRKS